MAKDKETYCAAVYGVTKSRTRLNNNHRNNHLSDLEVSYVTQIWNQFSKLTVPNSTDQHILTTEYFFIEHVLVQIPTSQ